MSVTGRTAALAILVLPTILAIASPRPARALSRGEEPPPAPPPTPPAAAPPAQESEEVRALRKEMEESFLRVERDFSVLTGPKAAETLAALAKAVETAAAEAGGTLPRERVPEVWIRAKIIGPEVAPRLHERQSALAAKPDASGNARPYAETLAEAVRLVFPEATATDNWDRHFLDLDVVRRWAQASGAARVPRSSGEEEKPTPPAAPPESAPDPSDMVLVPKGDLAIPEHRGRGWPNLDQKADRRPVRAFYLDRTEVSCAAYAAFLRDLRDAKQRDRILPTGWRLDEQGDPVLPPGAAPLPVSGVPYEGAAAFAAFHGKRLPTEDEWERAARGNEGLRFPWGIEWIDGHAVAGGRPGPAAVGTAPGDVSPFGARDLCGNVSELCATLADGKPIKGLPKADAQVVRRGGNFRDPAEEAANDWRYVIGAAARSEFVGFRCAMDEREFEKRYGKK
ncbi:MAG TPA: SUMF1/EgtB/PvdO family nonheme iron enzyme [Planctomycetota bacterium]|nr:SUMF1/EgtB/PvdO family nonheme iron enzyme [Planctomycetota bacterium]